MNINKHKIINSISLIFLLSLISCNETVKYKQTNKEDKLIDYFTVIVSSKEDNPPILLSLSKSFENLDKFEFFFKKTDTFNIKANKWNQILLGSKETFIDSLFIKTGDTLMLTFKDGILKKQFKNKKIEKWSYSNILKNSKIKKEVDSLYNLFFKIDYSNPLEIFHEFTKTKTYRIIPNIKKIKKEKNILEKLNEKYKYLIDEYEKENSKYDVSKKTLLNELLKNKILLDLLTYDNFFKDNRLVNFITQDVFDPIDTIENPYQFNYLSTLLFWVHFKGNKNNKFLELHQIYDSIPNHFNKKWVEKARMIVIEQMAVRGNDLKNTTKYLSNFNNEYENDYFIKYIEENFLINLRKIYNSKDKVNLMNSAGEVTNLDRLLVSLRGKLVYVDYWASWCGPCREAMPAMRKLEDNYKNKNIAFVYFSIDTENKKWLEASKNESINNHNYLILNHKNSNLKNNLKINTIPRYLLFDKKGKLLLKNAPSPKSRELKVKLNKLLQNN